MQLRTILSACALVLGGALTAAPAAVAASTTPQAPDKPHAVTVGQCLDGGGHPAGPICVGGEYAGELILGA